MKFRIFAAAALLIGSACSAFAQDPTKAAPENYKLQFENDWVKVLRVHYPANSKVPVHDHSKGPAAYVYLVDSGPVRFVHADWDHDPVLTRPATKAGSFRLSPTRFDNERHAVENISPTDSHFLRIELKTEAPDRQSLNARVKPYAGSREGGLNKIDFENSQLRVTRVISKPGAPLEFTANTGQPSLVVVLVGPLPGETVWLAPNDSKTFSVRPGSQIELLRFDFKTKPQKK